MGFYLIADLEFEDQGAGGSADLVGEYREVVGTGGVGALKKSCREPALGVEGLERDRGGFG